MFPFGTCIGILRRKENVKLWKQTQGVSNLDIVDGTSVERRGGISFERTDKNAIYIRMLGDVKLRGGTEKKDASVPEGVLSESEIRMIDKLASGDKPLLRSRFLSVSTKKRHRKKSRSKLSLQRQLLLDEFYSAPSQILLSRIGCWHVDIFSLDSLVGGRSMFHVGYHLFQSYDLPRIFQLQTVRMIQFFSLLEENYHMTNPYHNSTHAADVTQAMHCFLQEKEINQSTNSLEKMVALVASLSHDLDHPGVNNGYLIETHNHLAALYKNKSVLENHHWRCASGLLQETGLLDHLPDEQRNFFFDTLKTLILATDITLQQEFLLKFSRYIESGEFQYRRNQEHRLFMLQIALKCADISNPCRPWKLSERWSKRVCKEFFLQGDSERSLGLPVTQLYDRFNNTVANIQIGFMQFVVNPLFKAWDKFISTDLSQKMLEHLAQNEVQWRTIAEQTAQEKSEKSSISEEKLEEVDDMVDKTSVDTYEEINENIMDAEVIQKLREAQEKLEESSARDALNVLYHYPENENIRCLSPVNEDLEISSYVSSKNRRFSVPHLSVRRDLNFYLGLRKEGSGQRNPFLRRQSLPATALCFHSSSSPSSTSTTQQQTNTRSLSVDALLVRPKISNLSPSMDTGLALGPDPLNFNSLQNQTLILQKGSLTRFISNPTSRRSSYDQVLSSSKFCDNNNSMEFPNDLIIPSYQSLNKLEKGAPAVGLASSWPSVAQRKTTNGSNYPRNIINHHFHHHHQQNQIPDLHSQTLESKPSLTDSDAELSRQLLPTNNNPEPHNLTSNSSISNSNTGANSCVTVTFSEDTRDC